MPILPASYYRPIFSKWRVSEKVNDDRIRFQPSEIAATSFLQRNPKLKYSSGLSPTHNVVCGSVGGRKLSGKLWKNTASSPKFCFAHELSAKVSCKTLTVLLLCGVGFSLALWSVVGIRGQALFFHFYPPDSLPQPTAEGVSGSVGLICLGGLNHNIVHNAQLENHQWWCNI